MSIPVIVNIDSQFDWTDEVGKIWKGIDWDGLRINGVSQGEWNGRRDDIVLIGLCSSLLIEDAYRWNMKDDDETCSKNSENNRDDYGLDRWKERQTESRNRENSNENRPRFRKPTGEEPHFRSPNTGDRGVVECYGIYVENWAAYLRGRIEGVIKDNGIELPEGPAILLCPELIIEIYPALMTLGEEFRNPLTLSTNPTLVNLRMVLLHELGHHFLPVHRSGVGKHVSEGLANYFCLKGLDWTERPWLLYKTWHLQPPEYSAYRFLELLNKRLDLLRVKADWGSYYQDELEKSLLRRMSEAFERFPIYLKRAFEEAFRGRIDGWGWDGIFCSYEWTIEMISENYTMAMECDSVPALNFLKDLDEFLGNRNNSCKWTGRRDLRNGKFGRLKDTRGCIPADFLYDLHEDNSILPWVFVPNIPEEFWRGWGVRNDLWAKGMDSNPPEEVLSWPAGHLFRTTKENDWWRIFKESPYLWARQAAVVWLLTGGTEAQIIDVLKSFKKESEEFERDDWYGREPISAAFDRLAKSNNPSIKEAAEEAKRRL